MIKQLSFLKIKLFFNIILVILFLSISVEVLGMPWPISQFETQHPITATLGEFRRPWRFHAGIDIGRGAGTPVYPVTNGIVKGIKRDDDAYVEVEDEVKRKYKYIHMRPSADLNEGQPVIAGVTVLGTILSPKNPKMGPHLHFEINGGAINPLCDPPIGLNPSPTQSIPPIVNKPEFRKDNTAGDSAVYYVDRMGERLVIHGKVDIITKARERFDAQNGGSQNCGVYRMDYRIIDTLRNLEFGPFESFRFDSLYNIRSVTEIYARD